LANKKNVLLTKRAKGGGDKDCGLKKEAGRGFCTGGPGTAEKYGPHPHNKEKKCGRSTLGGRVGGKMISRRGGNVARRGEKKVPEDSFEKTNSPE